MRVTPYEYAQLLSRQKRLEETGSVDPSEGVTRESDLHEQILAECKRRGWIALHGSMAHRTFRTAGEWDFVIVADAGRVHLIECKTRTGKSTPEQIGLRIMAERLGHKPAIVRSFRGFLAVVAEAIGGGK